MNVAVQSLVREYEKSKVLVYYSIVPCPYREEITIAIGTTTVRGL